MLKKYLFFIVITFFLLGLYGCNNSAMGDKMRLSNIKGATNPNYSALNSNNLSYDDDYASLLQAFSIKSAQAIIEPGSKNVVISPISYYMTLAMLSEMTNGICFDEILTALQMPNLPYIRRNSQKLFCDHFNIDGDFHRIFMGNSLWIDDTFKVNKTLLDELAKYYYALSFNGDLQSIKTAKKIKEWIDSSTDKLIKSIPEDYIQDKDVALVFFNTLLFKAKWQDKFISSNINEFILSNKEKIKANYMLDNTGSKAYVDDDFISYYKTFSNAYYMSFILPNESLTPMDLIQDDILTKIISSKKSPNQLDAVAHLPKFSIPYEVDLIEPTTKLGIKEIFNPINQGFEKVNDEIGVFVSLYKQKTYLEIDETGIKAAAVTTVAVKSDSIALPKDPLTIVFNRPFIFIVYDSLDIPLFMGIINNPNT